MTLSDAMVAIELLSEQMRLLTIRLDAMEAPAGGSRIVHAHPKPSIDPVSLCRLGGVQVFLKGTDTDIIRELYNKFGEAHLNAAITACRGGTGPVYVSTLAQWMHSNKPAMRENGPVDYDATRDNLCVTPHVGHKGALMVRYNKAKNKPTDVTAIDALMAEYPQFKPLIIRRKIC